VIQAGPGAVSGVVAPGYERVGEAFAATADGSPCAFAACVDGRLVCDLHAGGFGPDSATVLYSGTKGVAATALLLLVDDGVLDLDGPVAAVWPEFAAAGKSEITVATLLAHAAGLPAVERALGRRDLADARAVAAALAAQAPMFEAGVPSYHAVTWGWLAGELALRVGGRTLGAVIHDRLAGPLGLDLRLGLRADDPLAGRLLRPQLAPGYHLTAFLAQEPDPRLERVYANPRIPIDSWADPDLLAIEAPAVNGVATARAMATLYGQLACGRVLRPETLSRAAQTAAEGDDPLTGRPLRYGTSGYELAGTPSELGPAADAIGHTGAGGGSHGAWPGLRTGFSFLPAELRSQDADRRAADMLTALHEAVAA
jgi:CubicO group peptidase (beta-lactamase class C family)